MGDDYIQLEEAVQQSGLHPNTLRRLLREGVLRGFKTTHEGRHRWLVSAASLKQYADPLHGFLLDLPGPKLFLRKLDEKEGEDDPG